MSFHSNPLPYVEAIYCISLPQRVERWKQAQEEFRLVGIQDRVIRFPAIERPDPVDGCRLSHLSIIREAREKNLETILIFEDDVQFISHCLEPLRVALDSLRSLGNWNMLYLGGRVVSPVTVLSEQLFQAQFWSAHAYLINRRAYGKAMQATGSIDVWYSRNIRRCYGVKPMLATQRKGYSDIAHRYVTYKTDAFLQSYENAKKRTYRGETWSACYALYDFMTGGVRGLLDKFRN